MGPDPYNDRIATRSFRPREAWGRVQGVGADAHEARFGEEYLESCFLSLSFFESEP